MRRGLNEDVFMSDTAELETKLAFVEDTVRALDAALATQQQHMLQLQQELDALRIRLREQGTRLDAMTPCLLYTSPSPRDYAASRMPSSA